MKVLQSVAVVLGIFLGGAEAHASSYTLGNATINIAVSGRSGGLTFFAPHQNETTAVSAARSVIAKKGGWLIQLMHGGGRNISFTLGGKKCVFDPNRMFTSAGLTKTLRDLSPGCPPQATPLVAGFAKAVLGEIKKHPAFGRGIVVAIHNNTDGGGLSVLTYRGGRDASQVFVSPTKDPDDFFLVTHSGVFSTIKAAGYNVVLQAGGATNDGSLSVYAAGAGLGYVNVEAQQGHLAEQTKMLDDLWH